MLTKAEVSLRICTSLSPSPVAYPELVSGGVSKSHKFKGLVNVGASKGVIRVDLKKIMAGGGGFPGNQKTPLDTPLESIHTTPNSIQGLFNLFSVVGSDD